VTGLVNQELLLRNEYLVAENRILKARINGRLRLSDTLAEIAKRLGRKVLPDIARVAQPDTLLAWDRNRTPNGADSVVARESTWQSRSWWRSWLGRIPVGARIESPEPWPIWVIGSQTHRSATFFAVTTFHPRPSARRTRLGRTSSAPTGSALAGTDFFFR
jgi:hypothetical protein